MFSSYRLWVFAFCLFEKENIYIYILLCSLEANFIRLNCKLLVNSIMFRVLKSMISEKGESMRELKMYTVDSFVMSRWFVLSDGWNWSLLSDFSGSDRVFEEVLFAKTMSSEEGRVHPDCRNTSNPYHECSDYCFRIIAEVKAQMDQNQSGLIFFFPLFFSLYMYAHTATYRIVRSLWSTSSLDV